jgi:hypothetical protein
LWQGKFRSIELKGCQEVKNDAQNTDSP